MTRLLGISVTFLLVAFVGGLPAQVETPKSVGEANTEESVGEGPVTEQPTAIQSNSGPASQANEAIPRAERVPQDAVPQNSRSVDTPGNADSTPRLDAHKSLQQALEALEAARKSVAANPQDDAARQQSERALNELRKVRSALASRCDVHCKVYEPKHCPPVNKYCQAQDACIIVKLPPIQYAQDTYSEQGIYTFMTIFNAAAARGVENATIRAMNGTKACPDCIADAPDTVPSHEHRTKVSSEG